jgi:hypothetical protein
MVVEIQVMQLQRLEKHRMETPEPLEETGVLPVLSISNLGVSLAMTK